jgi:kinesin family protein 2/24
LFKYLCFICLLSIYFFQQVISEPFEPSPFIPGGTREFEDDFNSVSFKQGGGETIADASHFLPVNEKENNTRENNVAKIKVVVC